MNSVWQALTKAEHARWSLFLSFSLVPILARNVFKRLASSSTLVNRSKITVTNAVNSVSLSGADLVKHWEAKDHEHAYLQDVLGDKALTWVKRRNVEALSAIGDPTNTPLYNKILSILDSQEKIPYVTLLHDDWLYNFWQDERTQRGLWRRTKASSYADAAATTWETVLDLDALGKEENESWVYKGYVYCDHKHSSGRRRVLLQLSRGGSDATVIREFDLLSKTFVDASHDGFIVPEAKSDASWLDPDTLLIGTKLSDIVVNGIASDLTTSGYPRVVRRWRRGTPLSSAEEVFAGEDSDVIVRGYCHRHGAFSYEVHSRAPTFFTEQVRLRVISTDTNTDGRNQSAVWYTLPLPADCDVGFFADTLLITLRSDWTVSVGATVGTATKTTFSSGSLISTPLSPLLHLLDNIPVPAEADLFLTQVTTLFAPVPQRTSLDTYTVLRDFLVLTELDTVKTRLRFWRYAKDDGSDAKRWVEEQGEEVAQIRGVSVSALNRHTSNEYWLTVSSFLTPTQLLRGNADLAGPGVAQAQLLRSLSRQFDPEQRLIEQQFEATSADGTKIPYFVLTHRDTVKNGRNPCLLYGYGGFEISLTPSYSSVVGAGWLDADVDRHEARDTHNIYVVANIRGGGEFGPAWHQSALKANRNKAYEDFIAVAEDLIHTHRFTSARHLAIRGGSNGGLLMGNMFVQRPDLFQAVCCAVPLLDMKAYTKLLAGASWSAEYGDPDNADDWAYLQRYSAYHNLQTAPEKDTYPALLMTTSTRDDRVHPYHARAFVHRLLDTVPSATTATSTAKQHQTSKEAGAIGRGSVLYYENMEGGHGGAADNKQQAFMNALYLDFLRRTIVK